LLEDGEIAAIHHVRIERACALDELTEMCVQLGRTTRDIQRGYVRCFQKSEHRTHGFARHLLGASRPRVYVAMHATLIALVAEIDLQCLEAASMQGWKRRCVETGKRCMH